MAKKQADAIQDVEEMNMEESRVGQSFTIPAEAMPGLEALVAELRNAEAAFKAASVWAAKGQSNYFQYFRELLPQLDGWIFTANAETGEVTLLRRDE